LERLRILHEELLVVQEEAEALAAKKRVRTKKERKNILTAAFLKCSFFFFAGFC